MAINPFVPCNYYFDLDQPFTVVGFLDETELVNSTWYKNTIGPRGLHDGTVTLLAKSPAQFGALATMRDAGLPHHSQAELDTLRRLAPHIRRAAMIADLLDARALERDTLSAALDLMNAGVVLTDGAARVIYANDAARRFIDGGGLRKAGDELTARDAQGAHDLREAIASAASGTTVDIPKAGITVAIKGLDGRDLAAWVLPLDGGLRRDFGATFAARAAVFIRELGDTSPFPAELFVRRYGITPAECRVLMLLTQGMTPKEAAETLGVSLATAKTHISRLFEKTGTQRQADLIRLAMSALAPARR